VTQPAPDWDPAQYERFKAERSRPYYDLRSLVRPQPRRLLDLGCGTGELTRDLHRYVEAEETVGVDSSPAMLEKAAAFAGEGLRFEKGDIASFAGDDGFDLVFSNAALQWVPDHEQLFPRLARLVRPGGQLAVQMPANEDHASHITAADLARDPEFSAALGGHVRKWPLLAIERYATLLHALGFRDQHVRLQVYAHELASRDEVVEWVRGTLLTDYQKRLAPETFERFLARYREMLRARLPDDRPYLYAFKRVLLWGRRGD
jgi:trans-aconitate 2-methyltransferase